MPEKGSDSTYANIVFAGLAPRRSPNKAGKRHTAAPTKAVPNKKQRVLDPPQNLARQAGRLAAHSR